MFGTYVGKTKKFGLPQTVACTLTIKDGAHFDVDVEASGLRPVRCSNQVYSLASSKAPIAPIAFPNMGTKGDCLHDRLQAVHAKVVSASYNSLQNTVTLHFKGQVLSFKIVLKHQKRRGDEDEGEWQGRLRGGRSQRLY